MPYETSYDTGLKPFNHDKKRGKWASPMDFVYSCIGHSFNFDSVAVVPSIVFRDLGFYALIPYSIIFLVCTIPIVFIQSFLGQFSSTGFISVFRIAPLFKGIGYVSLALNLTTLTFYCLFASIPFFYFIHSLRPTLPWSCEGMNEWSDYSNVVNVHCNETHQVQFNDTYYGRRIQLPSLDFLANHLNATDWDGTYDLKYISFSWPLILCSLFIWILVWAVVTKTTEVIGKFFRYSAAVIVTLLGICFLRFMFLPGAFDAIVNFFNPNAFKPNNIIHLPYIPHMALSGLGPGWGSVITMASYNNFKTDTGRYSWLLCLGQFVVMFLTAFTWIFLENFLKAPSPHLLIINIGSQMMQFFSIPTALSFLEMPNFWSLLYFGMLTLGATTLMIVQLFSVLTSLFDEYEQLREFRKEVTAIAVGGLALASILFCSNYGIFALDSIANFATLTQVLLNLVLMLVVLWTYGRERFQRDLHFMTSRIYQTWTVYIVRFITPIFLVLPVVLGVAIVVQEFYDPFGLTMLFTAVFVLPWLFVPGYCIFKIMQTSGMLGMRFRRCVRPTDWYPANPADRQRYEETVQNPEISHQLTGIIDDED